MDINIIASEIGECASIFNLRDATWRIEPLFRIYKQKNELQKSIYRSFRGLINHKDFIMFLQKNGVKDNCIPTYNTIIKSMNAMEVAEVIEPAFKDILPDGINKNVGRALYDYKGRPNVMFAILYASVLRQGQEDPRRRLPTNEHILFFTKAIDQKLKADPDVSDASLVMSLRNKLKKTYKCDFEWNPPKAPELLTIDDLAATKKRARSTDDDVEALEQQMEKSSLDGGSASKRSKHVDVEMLQRQIEMYSYICSNPEVDEKIQELSKEEMDEDTWQEKLEYNFPTIEDENEVTELKRMRVEYGAFKDVVEKLFATHPDYKKIGMMMKDWAAGI